MGNEHEAPGRYHGEMGEVRYELLHLYAIELVACEHVGHGGDGDRHRLDVADHLEEPLVKARGLDLA